MGRRTWTDWPLASGQNLASSVPPISCMIGPPRARGGRPLGGCGVPGRRWCEQLWTSEFTLQFHRLQRFTIRKNQPAPPEVWPHVCRLRIQPCAVAGHARQRKRVVGIGEHRAGKLIPPDGNRRREGGAAGCVGAARAAEDVSRVLRPPFLHNLRALDVDLRSGRSLVADHLVGASAAALRADALAVGSGGDHDALAGLKHLGSLVDGAEGPCTGTRAIVVGCGGVVIHIVSL